MVFPGKAYNHIGRAVDVARSAQKTRLVIGGFGSRSTIYPALKEPLERPLGDRVCRGLITSLIKRNGGNLPRAPYYKLLRVFFVIPAPYRGTG